MSDIITKTTPAFRHQGPPQLPENPRFFTIREIAAEYRVTDITIRRAIRTLGVPTMTFGKRRLVPAEHKVQFDKLLQPGDAPRGYHAKARAAHTAKSNTNTAA